VTFAIRDLASTFLDCGRFTGSMAGIVRAAVAWLLDEPKILRE
jgi:hypothetical protein